MLSCNFSYRRGEFELNIQLDTHNLPHHQRLDQAKSQNQVTGILGASGAGKSTLLKVLAGLLKPQQGRINFDGQVFFDNQTRTFMPSYQRHVGLVFQDGQLFPHLSVQQNLLYGYRHLKPAQRRFELAQIVELLEIGSLIERRVTQLSGGEAQRVALGRALLYSPRLLLLDEPLSALDTRLKQQILPFFARIRDEIQIPMIYVTHQPQELEFLQADILHMAQGKLIHIP
ncbi:ATP-binding cassette domain-containing protein [Alkanindiges hydrocarboniclasticus]|uniref:ATP-binding cassette domain-containing protein n=1 Tax=Alkanindiges hydrocarboniclasticus TaxID=1907941 RepID=UPI00097844B6|nr:ATP-binding cassette domain-containing protein [Alkanindiges hydrocarboniclasticus]